MKTYKLNADVRASRGPRAVMVDVENDEGRIDEDTVQRLTDEALLLSGVLYSETFYYQKGQVRSHELAFEFTSPKDAGFFAGSTASPEEEDVA